MPTKGTTKCARKGIKGSKKGLKRQPRRVTVAADSGGGNEETDGSDGDCVAAAERDFKRQTRPPKDHFEKLLKVACLHHSYPVKHKLKDCAMMKKFMTAGTFSKGSRSGGDLEEKGATALLEEAKVMAVFS
jgi:hypothetical protein